MRPVQTLSIGAMHFFDVNCESGAAVVYSPIETVVRKTRGFDAVKRGKRLDSVEPAPRLELGTC